MHKDVIIYIKGSQSYDGMDSETMELVTPGELQDRDGGYTLSYRESDLTGLGGTLTTFQVEKERITLMREGTVSSHMIFEESRKCFSMYETPYGAMTVGISARRVRSDLSDAGGDIEIDYAIEIDHAVAGENVFHIHVRQVGDALPQ